jgi:hypothetical protein
VPELQLNWKAYRAPLLMCLLALASSLGSWGRHPKIDPFKNAPPPPRGLGFNSPVSHPTVLKITGPVRRADASYDLGWPFLGQFACPENPKNLPEVPAKILAFTGSRVHVRGFIVPIDITGDQTHMFALVPSQMSCCFGVTPRLNGWILVTTPAASPVALSNVDCLLEISGNFSAGPSPSEDEAGSLYRIDAASAEKVPHKL